MIAHLLIVLGVLILASYLDIKYKAVPSVILTGTIFAVLLLKNNVASVYFGLVAFVFAILIKDLISDVAGMEFGVADIKILTIIGLLVPNIFSMIMMIMIFLVFQFVYTLMWRWKVSKTEEMPFIPCLLAVYIALLILGGVA